jgi:hypothetical protein
VIAEVQNFALNPNPAATRSGTSRQGAPSMSVLDDPTGIARFLLNSLPADERQHVADVIHRQEREDLKRLRAQGHPASQPADLLITLLDTVVTALSVAKAAA